jgi:hypothetical protein
VGAGRDHIGQGADFRPMSPRHHDN